MILFTDDIAFAQRCIPQIDEWRSCEVAELSKPVGLLARELFETDSIMQAEIAFGEHWDYLFAVGHANRSQFDVLSGLSASGAELPDKVLCCAETGDDFHGFKNRGWKACQGNIHLCAYTRPQREIPGAMIGFMIAAVVAALQSIAFFNPQGEAPTIKWVNDILLGGDKIGGVLARLKTQGSNIESAVIGIGLNIEQKPPVTRDPHVPGVTSLSDVVANPDNCRHADVFPHLVETLGCHLEGLGRDEFIKLLDIYRRHSIILGRQVTIFEDARETSASVVAEGVVESIGTSLELSIKGLQKPIFKGRLVLGKIE